MSRLYSHHLVHDVTSACIYHATVKYSCVVLLLLLLWHPIRYSASCYCVCFGFVFSEFGFVISFVLWKFKK